MSKVTLDCSKVKSFIGDDELTSMKDIAENAKKVLVEKTGAGNDFLGWIDLPMKNSRELKRRHRRFRVIQKFLL